MVKKIVFDVFCEKFRPGSVVKKEEQSFGRMTAS
jgi:hypothetical protein